MNIGKVYNYNNVYGQIVSDNEVYTFSYYVTEDKVKDGDIVTFKVGDNEEKVATDVKLYKEKKDLKTLMREIRENSNNK